MLLHAFPVSSPSTTTTNLLPSFPLIQFPKPFKLKLDMFLNSNPITNFTLTKTHNSSKCNSTFQFTGSNDWNFADQIDEDDDGCPWEGAVIYKRNASVTNLEYCTTLESLGLAKLSSEISKSRASQMGLRVTKSIKDYPNGTPVLISLEVIRKKHKIRLEGIVRTVISLNCNMCGEPAAQSVYSDLSLLLCEEPIKEPETINMGVIYGEDKYNQDGNEEDSFIDFEDMLYFPVEEKVIDISKNIRDLIHVEITITAICDSKCKGLCLKCGVNLNTGNCSCGSNVVKEKSYGPLGNLKKQMQDHS